MMATFPSFPVVLMGILLGTSSLQDPDPASQVPADQNATTVDDVTVYGVTRRLMGAYVRSIGGAPSGRLSPRWDSGICVRIIEMDSYHASYLRDRIETVAAAIGLSPDRSPDCRPNISVYASGDPDDLADALVTSSRRRFQPGERNVSLGDAALVDFRTSDAPIRWWHVSMPMLVDGGGPAMPAGDADVGDPMATAVTVRNGSRLRGNVRDDLVGVTIIVDVDAIADFRFEAVSDFVAFVALAPVDPRAPTAGFDTILNLFHAPGISGLSLTDQDYLFALYSSSRAPASHSLQAAEIAGRMAAERRRRAGLSQP